MIVNNEFLFNQVNNEWLSIFKNEINKKYFKFIIEELENCAEENILCPSPKNIFKAFKKTSFSNLKVVIVGQDPYHGKGQANGLSFSVEDFIKIPPSLQNIYKELFTDLRLTSPQSGNLRNWAKQGVLLLNSSLTVEKGLPGSHQDKGWEVFTSEVLKIINIKKNNIVFVLWGKKAQEKGEFIDRKRHLVIESTHPSPFSAHNGFFGSKPFSKTNNYLSEKKIKPIDWQL